MPIRAKRASTRLSLLCFAALPWSHCQSLPPFITYTFTPTVTKALTYTEPPTTTAVISGRSATECNSYTFGTGEFVGDAGIGVDKYQGTCWTNSGYSNGDYKIEQSMIGTYAAYRISPPTAKASSFVASKGTLFFKCATAEPYAVYKFTDGALAKVGTITPTAAGAWTSTGMRVDNIASTVTYVVLPAATVLPVPGERTIVGTEATECKMDNMDGAAFDTIAVLTMKGGSGSCWTDGRYNNKDYRVERGSLAGSDGSFFDAYRFHPAATPKTAFTSSKTNLWFKAELANDYDLYSYDGKDIKKISSITDRKVGEFVNTGFALSDLAAATVMLFVPAGRRFSIYPVLSSTVDGAFLIGDSTYTVSARRFDTTGHAFIPGADWGLGPGTHNGNYGIPKKFYPVDRTDGREGVVWQDQTSKTVYMTWIAADLLSSETHSIYTGTENLISAASDGKTKIVMLFVGTGTPAAKDAPNTVKLVMAGSTPGAMANKENSLDASKSGLNVYKFSNPGASMAWNVQTNVIGVVLARTMTVSGDGLNHQGAIAVAFDANTLAVVKNHGQTSGHSFANSLLLLADGNFLSMDLGDNYPRGINLQQFNEQSGSRKGVLAYAFKTKHGTSAKSPAGATYDVYTEISTADQTFYKWSNDNYVYTELGHQGVVEVPDGLLIFFSGEKPPLDNSKTGSVLNVARNVGFVKLGKDLSSKTVLSSGAAETGGFYTFGGGWSDQKNEGVNFLTEFTDIETSASRLKTAKLSDTSILLYWEVWSKTEYKYSQLMTVDANGAKTAGPWTMTDKTVRLAIQDDLSIRDGKVVAYAGSAGKLLRYDFCNTGCSAAGSQSSKSPLSAMLTIKLGGTCADLNSALATATGRTALENGIKKAIAEGLGVDASQVIIKSLVPCTARRLQAASASTNTTLGVNYELVGASDDPVLVASVDALDVSSTPENTRMVAALNTEITAAAAATNDASVQSLTSTLLNGGVVITDASANATSVETAPTVTRTTTTMTAGPTAGPGGSNSGTNAAGGGGSSGTNPNLGSSGGNEGGAGTATTPASTGGTNGGTTNGGTNTGGTVGGGGGTNLATTTTTITVHVNGANSWLGPMHDASGGYTASALHLLAFTIAASVKMLLE